MKIRNLLFWLHLIAGSAAGLVIGTMALTGVAIAFEPQILDTLRSDIRQLDVDPGATRLPLEAIVEAAEAHRGSEAVSITLPAEPSSALRVYFGRKDFDFAHPATGAYLPDPAATSARVFQKLTSVHRWLGAEGESRPFFRGITGASNLAFIALGLSGLFLWMPRRFAWKTIRPILFFRRRLKGNARDFNIHHVVGIWTVPIILVVTLSATVISYPWATGLLYKATSEEMPKGGRPSSPKLLVDARESSSQPLSLDALAKSARAELPNAKEIDLVIPGAAKEGKLPAVQVSALEEGASRPEAVRNLVLDPYTGEVLYRAGYDHNLRAARIRGWMRYLHTGEALGFVGQLIAAIASLGGVFLVFTGLALSLRRFGRYRRRKARIASESKALAPPSA